MKTAIYIEDGTVQLVITPEGEFEKNALKTFKGKELDAKIFAGAFYGCQGGWIRHKNNDGGGYPPMNYGHRDNTDDSLIIRIDESESHET